MYIRDGGDTLSGAIGYVKHNFMEHPHSPFVHLSLPHLPLPKRLSEIYCPHYTGCLSTLRCVNSVQEIYTSGMEKLTSTCSVTRAYAHSSIHWEPKSVSPALRSGSGSPTHLHEDGSKPSQGHSMHGLSSMVPSALRVVLTDRSKLVC